MTEPVRNASGPKAEADASSGAAGPSRRELWDARHSAHDPIEAHEPDPTLVAVARDLAPGRALDLGTGDGRNAIRLAADGWRVTAADFSGVALERAAAAAEAMGVEIDWRLVDLLTWEPDARAFDLVLLMFIHLPGDERRGVYERAAAAVAPGGSLLVVGHDLLNLAEGVGGPQDPDVLFVPAEVVAGLPAGFTVVQAATVRRGPGAAVPIDAVVHARRAGTHRSA